MSTSTTSVWSQRRLPARGGVPATVVEQGRGTGARILRAALATTLLWTAFLAIWPWEARAADQSRIERGRYPVTLGGCNDCHTPGYFFGKPDPARTLGGCTGRPARCRP